ncbi:MAG: hypothetical protein Q9210_005213 [Variospora velana]
MADGTLAGSIALGLTGLSTIPTLIVFIKGLRSGGRDVYERPEKLYEDEDGVATTSSEKTFFTGLPVYTLLAGTTLGLSLSIATAVQSNVQAKKDQYVQDWFAFASWALLLFQVTRLFRERRPIERFNSAFIAAAAFLVLLISICYRAIFSEWNMPNQDAPTPHLIMSVLQVAFATVSCLLCLLLPRRPSVFSVGQPVDGQFTVSMLGRWTFAWADELLSFAKKNHGLDMVHLPRLHLGVRAEYLEKNFIMKKRTSILWKDLLRIHRMEWAGQALLAMSQGIIQFTPQIAMYKLLELLEQRSKGEAVADEAWLWVAGLGVSIIVTAWVEAFMHWVSWARMGSPIRSELSALIFSKSTRRKDVKGQQKASRVGNIEANGATEPAANGLATQQRTQPDGPTLKPLDEDEDEDEESQKSRQSVINLVGVDTKRVSDFVSCHWIFSQTVAKVGASTFFLVKLIGWQSLLAGFAFSILSLPFNIWASHNYSKTQTSLMKARDQKMVVVTEALQGIRQIKFSALESQWQTKIGKKRAEELALQWKAFAMDTIIIGIWILGPVMLSAVSLSVFAVLNGNLSPSIAFTTITVFAQIEMAMAVIPELTADGLEAWVSLRRISDYLTAPEKEYFTVPSGHVSFENAWLAWPADSQQEDVDRFVLRNVNLEFPAKKLSVISGKTGSGASPSTAGRGIQFSRADQGAGKSLLLASILGEVDKLSGTVRVPRAPEDRFDHKANKSNWIIDSAIAFVAQIPWIENATIKDNILFGLPFDKDRYTKVLTSCALSKDLDMLPDGELTDIGANGINLSGGQRWRVTFARALYSRAGILILDDIFSAVDAHVGRQLFEEALTGGLGKGRTRILVTHHVGLCMPKTDYAVLLGGGTVEYAGPFEELQQGGKLDQILEEEEQETETIQAQYNNEVKEAQAELGDHDDTLQKILTAVTERSVKTDDSEVDVNGKCQPKQFTEEEKREKGSVKFGIWGAYLNTSGGWWFWPPIVLFFCFYQLLVIGRSWWISVWTRSYESESVLLQQVAYRPSHYLGSSPSSDGAINAKTEHNGDLSFYLGIYVGISVLICFCGTSRYYVVFMASLKASRRLFDKLTYSILRAPLRWLDTVPVGRILNRFTADFAVIDSKIGKDVGFMLYQVTQLVGIIVAGLFVSPYMLLSALGLLVLCWFVALHFLAGAREAKRLESNAKSPIFEQFGSALAGIATIRAFAKADHYIDRYVGHQESNMKFTDGFPFSMFEKIDVHARAFWYIWLFNRWMAFRLNVIGAIFAILTAAVIVSAKETDASLAGFALSFALQYSGAITWTIRQYTSVELAMNAMERIVEYSQIPIEDQEGPAVPAAWPTEGRLQVEGLVAGYAPDLPPVLKGLSFDVARNQRVGVVGRTGAGKSSLTLALFRFLEAREGSIVIDGIDISKINLQQLRSRLAIIPQDPVLFSGTVRSNLDAFDEHGDAELYDALERVHLIRGTGNMSRAVEPSSSSAARTDEPGAMAIPDDNTNIFSSLSSRISEGGLNLSQGQRQLLCLARAIVSRPKIMVLDEATSAVDMATDVLIQRSIREEFGDSTLIVIAHRLSTIADFDRILVMSDGRAVEYDTPRELLAQRGVFWEMVEQSGERDRLEEILLGVNVGVEEGRA